MTAEMSAARRFYGRRFGRALRAGRRRLLNDLLPTLRSLPPTVLGPATLFQNPPKNVAWKSDSAAANIWLRRRWRIPMAALSAASPSSMAWRACLARLMRKGSATSRSIRMMREISSDRLPSDCLDRVFLLFPDPWPKSRHTARRFISAENLNSLARSCAMKRNFACQR